MLGTRRELLVQAKSIYEVWSRNQNLPPELLAELKAIEQQDDQIFDRFYRELEFGTGGLRGVIGAGTNRMNVYTVRKASRGLAEYILSQGPEAAHKGVVIGYDCRRMSPEFAVEVACVMAAAGVRAYVFEHLCPTPELSFAVRELGASAGVMITASHNPPEYNGYKVYGADGGQLLPQDADQVLAQIAEIDDLFAIPMVSQKEAVQSGLFTWVGADLDAAYVQAVVNGIRVASVPAEARQNLCVVFTPLHGTGNRPVREALAACGYTQVAVVQNQQEPDGEFPTVKSPNPEEREALSLAIELAKQTQSDIAFGTDPDADRVGVAVRLKDGSCQLLTGNQVGGLLVDFVLRMKSQGGTLPKNGIVFKTIVTSELGAEAARLYGIPTEDTLTGFKYIGERIGFYEQTGEKEFLFGYEESYGYLALPFVRDKDAVQICLLICEMAAYYKTQGLNLVDALHDLFKRVGFFLEELVSATLPGADGLAKIKRIMNTLRANSVALPGAQLVYVEDYEKRERTDVASGNADAMKLPQADVLKYIYSDGSWLAVRPSGTEPKIKFYLGAKGSSMDGCEQSLASLREAVQGILASE